MRMRTNLTLGVAATALLITTPLAALAQEIPGMVKSSWDAADTPVGVYCNINNIRLMARSTEDCSKAGGSVTHNLTTTVTPVSP